MKLSSYLQDESLSPSDFARQIGVTPRAVQFYLSGDRRPRWNIIARIAVVTGGAVTANDWAGYVEKKAEKRAA